MQEREVPNALMLGFNIFSTVPMHPESVYLDGLLIVPWTSSDRRLPRHLSWSGRCKWI